MKEPFVLSEVCRPGLDSIFSLTGIWGSAPGVNFVFRELLAMDQAFSRRHITGFDASLLHFTFVVHVVALIWTKEGRDNQGMGKTTYLGA
jgi:hypothetical protein